MATLNKVRTKNAIIKKAQASFGMSIDVDGFKKKIRTNADILEACVFVRVEPIYT
tara:strand:+ start:25028 stop:25192 length:165 start_codon:yes stop_codon:yes gene_type:complete